MKRWLVGIFAAGCFLISPQVSSAADATISPDIYEWVQSTARTTYYFNKAVLCYGVDEQGIIDMDVLIVPTLMTYDSLHIQDVRSKRRWNMVSTAGYENLVGAAEYLRFRLSERTVLVTEHQDLNRSWGVLEKTNPKKLVKIDSLSEKSVEGIFYRAILEYETEHREEIIEHTKGRLSEDDRKRLEKEKKEREEKEKKALKEKEKQERAEKKAREKRERAEKKEREKREKAERKAREAREKAEREERRQQESERKNQTEQDVMAEETVKEQQYQQEPLTGMEKKERVHVKENDTEKVSVEQIYTEKVYQKTGSD